MFQNNLNHSEFKLIIQTSKLYISIIEYSVYPERCEKVIVILCAYITFNINLYRHQIYFVKIERIFTSRHPMGYLLNNLMLYV